jgi:hypothetical protein
MLIVSTSPRSSTWTGVAINAYNSTRSDPTWVHFNSPGITKVGYETIHFPADGSGGTIAGFGLALNQFGNNSNVGMLGLGVDSLLLDTAVKMNVTPSRGWSMDAGSQSLDNPRPGELVLGGYNQKRLDGSLIWQNVSDMSGDRPCPLRTKITDMYITLANATQIPLKSSGEIIQACIEPYDNLFRFTPGMLLNWKQITGFEDNMLSIFNPGGSNTQNLSFTENPLPYNSSKLFDWSLSITLDSGYTTTIPQYELMAPLRGWNALGEKKVVPGMTAVGILDAPTGIGEIPTLGKVFLSQSYLAVNYDLHQFGLAKLATDQAVTSNLVPFSCKQATVPESPSPSPRSSITNHKKNATPIIGGVVGGAVFLLALGAIVFFVLRRKKRASSTQIAEAVNEASNMTYQWVQSPPSEPWVATAGDSFDPRPPRQIHEMGVEGAKPYIQSYAVELGTNNEELERKMGHQK